MEIDRNLRDKLALEICKEIARQGYSNRRDDDQVDIFVDDNGRKLRLNVLRLAERCIVITSGVHDSGQTRPDAFDVKRDTRVIRKGKDDEKFQR